jgi:zinc protease
VEKNFLNLATAKDFKIVNGLKVIHAKDDSNKLICMQLHIKTGSTNETDSTSGFSHFIEHLTFKSTREYPDNQISEIIPALGGVINAYTELDTTCYYLMLPSEHFEHGISILSQLAFHANFDAEDVRIEKDIIIEEIKQYANEPEAKFIDHIQKTYFLNSPLKTPILGNINSIRHADYQSLRNFYEEEYRPDNSILVIAGNIDFELVQERVQASFGGWGKSNLFKLTEPELFAPELNGFRFNSKTSTKTGEYLAFVLPELSEREELSMALLIIMKAFASGQQSSLYKRLVEKDKTALEIRLHSISGLQNGITVIQVFPANPNSISDLIYAFYDEWQKVKCSFFDPEDLKLLIKEMNYAWMYDFEYIESLAGALGTEEIINNYKELYKFPQKLSLVNSKQFQQCIDLYWKTGYLSIYYQGRNRFSPVIVKNILKLYGNDTAVNVDKFPTKIIYKSQQFRLLTDKSKHSSVLASDELKQVRLDNGFNLIMRQVRNKPTVGLSLTSPLSQLCEDVSSRGLNYFMSAMLLFGTRNKTYDDIQKDCLHNGFSLRTSQSIETTSLKGKCLSFNLIPMLNLVAEIAQMPSFPKHYFSFIKSTVADSIRREKASPFSHAFDSWVNLFLGSQNNLNKPYGYINEVKHIRLEQMIKWYERYYNLSNTTLSLAGDFEFSEIEDICNRAFNFPKGQSVPPQPAYCYETPIVKLKFRKVSADQSNIFVGGFGTSSSEIGANTALYALSQIIGGDLSSRFYTILREKHGFAYQTGFEIVTTKDLGYWFGYVTCDKTDYKSAYQLMHKILADIRQNGVTDNELISARNYLLGMHRMDMESVGWQASTLADIYALGFDYSYFAEREQRIRAIDHEAINEVAARCFNPDNLYSYIEK